MPIFKYAKNSILNKLELPADSLGGEFRLQIIGDSAILCGCKKILNYQIDTISALTNQNIVTFYGENVKCTYFYDGTLEICGNIQGVTIDAK